METLKFFFYGSLRKGGYNVSVIPENSKFIRNVTLPFKLYQTPYGYPAISKESGKVIGEIYEVPSEGLEQLDHLEGYEGKNNPNNLYDRFSIKLGNDVVFVYFGGKELIDVCKEFNVIIKDGDWIKFYNEVWLPLEGQEDITGEFTEEDLQEVCTEFGADSIEEVNVMLESICRRNIILEAEDKKNEDDEEDKLDDLSEPEKPELDIKDDVEEPQEGPQEPEEAPSLDDLTEPSEDPTKPVKEPVKPKEAPSPKVIPPQPASIPSSKQLSPEEKKEEPQVAVDWKKEKHLRTLYNNFFKIFPKRGESTILNIHFNAVKANALHPESKYVQANVTSTCESENHAGKYYNQWIQLRRQRQTQQWSVDLPCEVRCNCKSFIYYMAYANMKNKSLAGAITRKGKLDGYPINYTLPSMETNPNMIPALCKHLVALTNQIFNVKGDGKVRKDVVV